MRFLLFGIGVVTLFSHRHTISVPRHCHRSSSCVNTAVTADLILLILNVLGRTFRRGRNLHVMSVTEDCTKAGFTHLVPEHKDVVVVHEVSVDVLESAPCCFGVEEIHEWHKRSVEDSPDDVELPAQGADADRSDFYHYKVAWTCYQYQGRLVLLHGARTHPVRRSTQRRTLVFH